MQIEHYTNRPDLWLQVGNGLTNFCLWDLGHEGPTIPVARFLNSEIWNTVQHIFLIDKEAHSQMLETMLSDTRIHIWDSLVVSDQPRWHSYFWWWSAVVDVCKEKNLLQDLTDPTIKSPPLLFDCILGKINKSRIWLYDKIRADSFLQGKILLNFYGRGDPYLRATDYVWETYKEGNLHGSSINFQDKYKLPTVTVLPVNIYKNSWFSIIVESRSDHTRFFSEKTAKPLLGKRLFVLIAAPRMLRDLRTLGFKTFSDIFDESYDDIDNDEIRWGRALDQIRWLGQQDPYWVYKKALPILEHNQRHMLSLNSLDTMLGQMQNILSSNK